MKKKIDSYIRGEYVNGVIFIKHISYGTNRKSMFKCPKCNNDWITRFTKVRSGAAKMCKKCSCNRNVKIMNNSPGKIASYSNRMCFYESLHKEAFRSIKKSATKRRIKFELTLDFTIKLITKNCYYCGSNPNQLKKNRLYNFFHHGIDRVDNDIHYTTKNVVSCCRTCNMGKNTLSIDEWESYLNNLVEYRNGLK